MQVKQVDPGCKKAFPSQACMTATRNTRKEVKDCSSKAILAMAVRVAITRRLAEERRKEDPRSRKEPSVHRLVTKKRSIERRNRQIEYIVVQNFSILKKQPICNIFQFRNLRFANWYRLSLWNIIFNKMLQESPDLFVSLWRVAETNICCPLEQIRENPW